MSMISADEALRIWEKGKLLTPEEVKKFRAYLEKRSGEVHTNRGLVAFATLGAVLVGLGILLFVGSNWANMSPLLRACVLFTSYAVIAAAATVCGQRGFVKVAEALWFLTTISLGANIFFLAQIFHFSLTYWQGPALWLLGVLAMGIARQKRMYASLAVPLVVFTVGWLGGGAGWFMDDQFEFLISDQGLRPLFAALGVGFIALALLARRAPWIRFGAVTWLRWGMLLVAVPLVVTAFHQEVAGEFFRIAFTLKQILILLGVAVCVALAIGLGEVRSSMTRFVLVALTALVFLLLLRSGNDPMLGVLFDRHIVWFAGYVLLLFVVALLCMWFGVAVRNPDLINLGIASAAVIITAQYFSWSFLLLDRSVAFIAGGITILILSIVLEKTRRRLVSRTRR